MRNTQFVFLRTCEQKQFYSSGIVFTSDTSVQLSMVLTIQDNHFLAMLYSKRCVVCSESARNFNSLYKLLSLLDHMTYIENFQFYLLYILCRDENQTKCDLHTVCILVINIINVVSHCKGIALQRYWQLRYYLIYQIMITYFFYLFYVIEELLLVLAYPASIHPK